MGSKNKRFLIAKPKESSSALSFGKASLKIEKLSLGGDGVARQDGLVYFVPLSAPEDHLEVQITEKKKNFARAEISKILEAGPHRISPPCPVFRKCGGCNWQQITYAEQLKQKQKIVEEQLSRLVDSQTKIHTIIASPKSLRYRNRVQLKFDGKNLGFFGRQSHSIVDIDDCLITEELLADQIPKLKNDLLSRKAVAIPKIELFVDLDGKAVQVFEDSPFEGLGFSQVNTAQNTKLIETVLNWLDSSSPKKIYDLYSGSGNFTFPLLVRYPKASLVGVELNQRSVQMAQKKLQTLNLSPLCLNFFLSDVEIFLKKQVLEKDSIVLLDPPRAGCAPEVIRALAQQDVKKIVYLSCNPSALARDLKLLKDLGGWRLVQIQPFDMFPQTDHIETLVELIQ